MSVKIALAGNPNSGKTTLFNALTGSSQQVGNWPGVTVEKKEGKLKFDKDVVIQDLPGIYSLSPYTMEEVVTRKYLVNERPDAVINIVDGTNLERNLYLSTQVMELGIPVVLAVNMIDLVRKKGDEIHLEALARYMGCEVVEISALKGTGIEEAASAAIRLANEKKNNHVVHKFSPEMEDVLAQIEKKLPDSVLKSQRRFFAIKLFERDEKIHELLPNAPDVESIIAHVESAMDDDAESIITNERYNYISSIIDKCLTRKNQGGLTTSDKIDLIVTNRILGLPIFILVMFLIYYIAMSAVGSFATDWANDGLFGNGYHLFGIGSGAYEEAAGVYEKAYNGMLESFEDKAAAMGLSEQMSAYLQENGFEGIEFSYQAKGFIEENAGAMAAAYGVNLPADMNDEEAVDEFTRAVVAKMCGMEEPDPAAYGKWIPGIPVLVKDFLDSIHCAEWLQSLILDGIIGGVGSVLGFVPQLLILFLMLAIVEDIGYMARVAFVMDKLFRRFGLSGKSFIPMLISTGCGVPAIMASRTIESDKDRKITIMTATFIPCSAKIPLVAFIVGACFGGQPLVATSTYFIGVACILISGVILKKTPLFGGVPAPFVMELPAYHIPSAGNVLRSMWERGWSFIKKAGTLILLATVIIWLLSSFSLRLQFGVDIEESILHDIGSLFSWIFAPLGWADWKGAVATISGLLAKENVVGTMGVLFGLAEVADEGNEIWKAFGAEFGALAGFSFLLFNQLCAPCFAAMGAYKRELNSTKWFWITFAYQMIFAYVVAMIVYQLGNLIFNGVFSLWTLTALVLLAAVLTLLFRPDPNKKNNA